MSSGDQVTKTKQELLAEYESDYLARLEKKEPEPADLQDIIFQMTKEAKEVHEKKDYVGLCAFCTMGVARDEMAYKNNRLFHSNCFEQQGKNFPAVNQELLSQRLSAKVELVQLKNLKIRMVGSSNPSISKSSTKKKSKKRSKKKRKPKRKTIRRKSARRKKPRRKTRRRPARKARRRSSKKKRGRRRR